MPALDGRAFDYLVPDEIAEVTHVGTIVRVGLAGRRVRGWVVEDEVEPVAAPERLKPLLGAVSEGPPAAVVGLTAWVAWRFAGPRLPLLRIASPPAIVVPRPRSDSVARNRRQPTISRQGTAGPGAPDPEVEGLVEASLLDLPVTVVRWPPYRDPIHLLDVLAHGEGSVLVIVPDRRAAGLARRLAALHRGVVPYLAEGRPRERAAAWERASRGCSTLVGGRGTVFAPVPDLERIVVVDEGAEAHKDERSPAWHARDVALERARRHCLFPVSAPSSGPGSVVAGPAPRRAAVPGPVAAPVTLVSPAPTLEALAAGPLLRISVAGERFGWPVTEVVDRRAERPGAGLFSGRFAAAAHASLDAGERVVCVLNRKGRARLLACAACGELARCETCHAAVAEAPDAPNRLVCGRCTQARPRLCASCGSTRLKILRAGVSRIREELAALFPRAAVALVDTSTTAVPEDPVLVGTEAVLHRVRRAGLVAFLDFDQELLAPRLRAAEQALWLLVRAARLVGPRDSGGRTLIQTRLPSHEVLQAAVRGDPGLVAVAEDGRRRPLELPPFGALARLSGDAESLAAASASLRASGVEVTPSAPVLARARTHRTLCDALAAARAQVRISVEMDPLRI